MENLSIRLDDPDLFDASVHGGLPEGGSQMIVTKPNATNQGQPAVFISFTVQLPSGQIVQAQTVMTCRLFMAAAAAMRGRYGDL